MKKRDEIRADAFDIFMTSLAATIRKRGNVQAFLSDLQSLIENSPARYASSQENDALKDILSVVYLGPLKDDLNEK